MTYALTIWQPWASLIMIGAKPYEFRRWDYRERNRDLVGQCIVIHAGTRPVKLEEVEWILEEGRGGVDIAIAEPFLRRLQGALATAEGAMPAYRSALALYRARAKRPRMIGDNLIEPIKPNGQILPLACGLGTAILQRPRRASELFRGRPDSDRIDHHVWAWPLTEIETWSEPIPMRGAQGFWQWPIAAEAA